MTLAPGILVAEPRRLLHLAAAACLIHGALPRSPRHVAGSRSSAGARRSFVAKRRR